jgi:hypothetical protein
MYLKMFLSVIVQALLHLEKQYFGKPIKNPWPRRF